MRGRGDRWLVPPFPPLTTVLVVAGDEHGGPKEQVAPLVELGKGLLFEQLLFAAFGLSTALIAFAP
jgi:hypothetical protein